ncbi:MAG TPA: 2-amino-4-hydroxy-6-hydroxymethyldihydropteridine diphosphokinase [Propionibacteriaceae bacterium]|nr:2-amino-4-hydroxy-6-hydroxymethyldihydropteridine diphosphokinase [Propionibacteriaceae bacterium]
MTTPEPTDALDRISISGIAAIGHHGVLAAERRDGQEFVIDVSCGVLRAEHSDQLRTTVNYAELAQAIVDDIEREPVNLIETLAERVAATCLDRPMVQQVGVRVHKPHAPIPVPFTDVTVEIERHRPRVRAVLSLGSNLDDPLSHLTGAVSRLRRSFGVDVLSVSPVYRTDPVGVRNQPDFLNIVVLVDTELSPEALLTTCHDIELAHERRRESVNGPRTLDIDIVTVGDEVRDDERLTLPHPRARERAFVLVPWLDLDPEAELPGAGPVQDLLASVGRRGVHPTAWRVDSDGML